MERHEFKKSTHGAIAGSQAFTCARDALKRGDDVRVYGFQNDSGTLSLKLNHDDYDLNKLFWFIHSLDKEPLGITVIVFVKDQIVKDLREVVDDLKSKLAREELMGAVWKYLATIEDASYVDGFAVRDDPNLIVCHLSEEGDLIGFTDDMEDFFRETYGASTIFFPNNCDEEFHKFVKEIMHD